MDKSAILKSVDSSANGFPRVVDITIHKHIEYANNLIITESSFKDSDLSFIGHSIANEWPALIGYDEEIFHEYMNSVLPKEIDVSEFKKTYKAELLDKAVAHRLPIDDIEYVIELLEPDNERYDVWYFAKSKNRRFCIFFDFCD